VTEWGSFAVRVRQIKRFAPLGKRRRDDFDAFENAKTASRTVPHANHFLPIRAFLIDSAPARAPANELSVKNFL
jgi:hypothetical protein